jgi:hypothetical protein
MSERKLATIRRIADLVPIAGADRIELDRDMSFKAVSNEYLLATGK